MSIIPKITLISDLTLNLIVNKLKDKGDIKYLFGDIISILNSHEFTTNYVIIYFDNFFSNRSLEDTNILLKHVAIVVEKYPTINFLISNQLQQDESTNLKYYISNNCQLDCLFHDIIINNNNVYVLDTSRILSKIGFLNVYQFSLGHTYQMPYKSEFIEAVSVLIFNTIKFLASEEKKCIITDLDNTLWGGILGEEGVEKLKIDVTYNGIIYNHYQKFLKQKINEGFLVCICSKNNIDEVKDAFQRLKMPLELNDFTLVKANWNPKHVNIEEISKELNIGLSSLIFIDDNPFEIENINISLPEVSTYIFKNNYFHFLDLKESFDFKRKRILKDDVEKSQLYKIEENRRQLESQISNFEEYLATLKIEIEVLVNDTENVDRISQLTEKTNQFNFNKEPMDVNSMLHFMKQHRVYSLSVRDKFGDYGIVGLILCEINTNKCTMKNFLMSCRALGKNIEDQFYNYVVNDLKKHSIDLNEIKFVKTEKNVPALNFINKYQFKNLI